MQVTIVAITIIAVKSNQLFLPAQSRNTYFNPLHIDIYYYIGTCLYVYTQTPVTRLLLQSSNTGDHG